MEQEKRLSLNADKSLRRALDIQKAKDLLRKEGFCGANLWNIDDGKQNQDCEDQDAMDVLDNACEDEFAVSETFDAIDRYIKDNNQDGEFKPKNNQNYERQ